MASSITRRTTLKLAAGVAGVATFHSARAAPVERLSLVTALGISGGEAPFFLALKKGWYRDAGIDLNVLVGRGSAYAFQLATSGGVNIAEGTSTTLAVGVQHGMPLLSFYALVRRSDFGMLVDVDSPIRGPSDLRGKRVLCFPTSPWVPFIDPYLKRGGLTRSDVTIVMVDPQAIFSTYVSGSVDVFLTVPSYALPLVASKRPSRAIASSDVGIFAAGTGLAAKKEFLTRKPELLRKFVTVTGRAVVYTYSGGQDEAAKATVEARPNDKLDVHKIRAQIDSREHYVTSDATAGRPVGWQSDVDWQKAISSMEEVHLLKPGTKPEEFFTNEFFGPNSPKL